MTTDKNNRSAIIRSRLEEAFSPQQLEVIDESDQHIGHAGHQGGGRHCAIASHLILLHIWCLYCCMDVMAALNNDITPSASKLLFSLFSPFSLFCVLCCVF